MKGKKKSVLATILVIVAVQIVVAQALGINLVDLVNQKTDSLASSSTLNTSSILQQTKQETLAETTSYIDGYIAEIQQSLDQYTESQTEIAKQKLKARAQEIKDALEAQKPDAVDSGKVKIKVKIDEELNKQLSDLDSQLTLKIQQKFSN
ncbi:MAG: hypothetical protein ACOYWZ_01225 [Bacillota bacterium]